MIHKTQQETTKQMIHKTQQETTIKQMIHKTQQESTTKQLIHINKKLTIYLDKQDNGLHNTMEHDNNKQLIQTQHSQRQKQNNNDLDKQVTDPQHTAGIVL
jgi:hypothetical protein